MLSRGLFLISYGYWAIPVVWSSCVRGDCTWPPRVHMCDVYCRYIASPVPPRCAHSHPQKICCNTFSRMQYFLPEAIQYLSGRGWAWTSQGVSVCLSGESSWINSSCTEENIYFLLQLLGASGILGVAGCLQAKSSWTRAVALSLPGTASHPHVLLPLPWSRPAVYPLRLTAPQRDSAARWQPVSVHEYNNCKLRHYSIVGYIHPTMFMTDIYTPLFYWWIYSPIAAEGNGALLKQVGMYNSLASEQLN